MRPPKPLTPPHMLPDLGFLLVQRTDGDRGLNVIFTKTAEVPWKLSASRMGGSHRGDKDRDVVSRGTGCAK